MSDSGQSALPRPRQVTMAGWMIIIGSVAVVLAAFQQVSSLHTLETREAIQRALAEPPANGLGVSLETARTAIRVLAMIAAACATAAAILGWQALQRSRSARVALAALVVPLFLSGLSTGSLLPAVVVAAALILWLQPARDWFDGKAPAPVAPAPPGAPRPPAQQFPPVPLEQARGQQQPVQPPPHPQAPVEPPPYPQAYAQPPAQPPAQPFAQPPAQQGWPPPYGQTWVAPAARRPVQVVYACVLVWACSGLAAGMMAMSALVVLVDPGLTQEVLDQNPSFADQGLTAATIRTLIVVTAVVVAVWGLASSVFAFLVWRRVAWAIWPLVASLALAALLLLLGGVANPVLIVPLIACVVTVTLLLRAEVRAWLGAAVR